jgi:hypothetical protein
MTMWTIQPLMKPTAMMPMPRMTVSRASRTRGMSRSDAR